MDITWYEEEKQQPITFAEIEVGGYFITAEDAKQIWTEDTGGNVQIFKKLDVNETNRFEAVGITEYSNEPFATFNQHDEVYSVDVKTLTIKIDW